MFIEEKLTALGWREQAWLLKKSCFVKRGKIWGIENV
jgi:hypothetical protein